MPNSKLNAKLKTGDVKIKQIKEADIVLTTGDIEIENVKKSIKLLTTTGDVKIKNATIKENSRINTSTGDIKINSISGCYVEGSSKVGDIKIYNNDRKSDIELNIKTKIGDIKVNY